MMHDWRKKLQGLKPIEWVVIACVVIGAVLRLWNFSNTLQFLGDQGRDAQVVSRIFKEKDIVLIGPVTSTGNMYLGPLYYYFMLPFLMMSYPSPLGPAYAVAVLSILTIFLMYKLGKDLVGEKAALFATILFTFSAMVIGFARFSWNPNPAPLLGLLFIWCLYKTEQKKPWFWVGVAGCIAVLVQLHYVTLLTLPIAGLVWLKQLKNWKELAKKTQKQFLTATVASVALFIASLSPLIAFDMRHDWLNVRSFQKFVTESQGSVAVMPFWKKMGVTVAETHGRSLQLFFETTLGKRGLSDAISEDVQRVINTVLLLSVIGMLLYFVVWKRNPHQLGHRLLALSYVVTVSGLAFYRSSVFDHYIAFFLPITFLIFGSILAKFTELKNQKYGWSIAGALLVLYLGYNIPRMPLRTLGWTITDMERTAKTIAERVKPGEKYNIVLLSETKDIYGENYRYYLTTTQTPPLRIERFGEVETLFIIDEQKLEKDVTSLPIYEIVVFPNKQASEVYSVPGGPQVTVLRKTHE